MRRAKTIGMNAATRQRGAVAVVVAFVLIVFIAMLGLVIDIGHLYIVKTELQNAADACALSAARELNDRGAGASNRGKAAGTTAGRNNRMDLQSIDVVLTADQVTFSDTIGNWSDTVGPNTQYVRCAPYESVPYSVTQWITHVGATNPMRVNAEAVARLVGGQTYCSIPLAVCSLSGSMDEFNKGQWYSGRLSSGSATTGNYDWIRFPGAQGASDIAEQLAGAGVCGIHPEVVDAQGGVLQGVGAAWNTRFGIYSNKYNEIDNPPDHVGYGFTRDRTNNKGETIPGSWPYLQTTPAPPLAAASYPPRIVATAPMVPASAYDGIKSNYSAPPGTGWVTDKMDANYSARVAEAGKPDGAYDPALLKYDANAFLTDKGEPVNLPGNAQPISGQRHHEVGRDRRLVFAPVIHCSDWAPNKKNMPVIGWACVLMVHPVNDPSTDVELEFRGPKGGSNDCATSGVPGGSGPPVPALVK